MTQNRFRNTTNHGPEDLASYLSRPCGQQLINQQEQTASEIMKE